MLIPPNMLVSMDLHGLSIFHWAFDNFSWVCVGKFQKHRVFIFGNNLCMYQDSHEAMWPWKADIFECLGWGKEDTGETKAYRALWEIDGFIL